MFGKKNLTEKWKSDKISFAAKKAAQTDPWKLNSRNKLTTHSQFGQWVSNRLWSDRPNTAKCQRERNGEKRTVFRKVKKMTSDKNNDKSLPVSKKPEDSQINWLGIKL